MALSPVFTGSPRTGGVTMATSDASYTNPTNFSTLITGASSGTQITDIIAKYTLSTSTVSLIRIFLYDGTTYYLYDEISVAAKDTILGQQPTARARANYTNLILPSSNWSIRVTNSLAQRIHITALGFDL